MSNIPACGRAGKLPVTKEMQKTQLDSMSNVQLRRSNVMQEFIGHWALGVACPSAAGDIEYR